MRIANREAGENAPGTHRSRALPLFERPRLRTRREGGRPTTWLEIFFDLVFVVAIDQVARRLQSDASLRGFAEFFVLYVPVWWAWVGYVIYTDRFGTDDLSDRLFTLAQMYAVLVIAVRAHDALERGAAAFALAYGAFRLILALRYAVAGIAIPDVRAPALQQAGGFAVAALLWMASAAVPGPRRFWLWGLGFGVDLAAPFLARGFHHAVTLDAEHLEERFGTFINIVLGEGFVGIVEGMRDIAWTAPAMLGGALALVSGFSIWWTYFETLDAAPIKVLGERKGSGAYKIWMFSHLPLAAGIAASGIAAGMVVHHIARPSLGGGERWLLAGGIGLCFVAFALLHVSYALAGGGRASLEVARVKAAVAVVALGIAALSRGLPALAVLGVLTLAMTAVVLADVRRRTSSREHRRHAHQS